MQSYWARAVELVDGPGRSEIIENNASEVVLDLFHFAILPDGTSLFRSSVGLIAPS